jgi:ubiquinone/menaquinone biosynthesis C-methylase UbiE
VEISGVHRTATAFEGTATVYERARPGYPAEAVHWLVDELGLGPGGCVLDLAAGTGKLTRHLVDTGARVVAVEPVADMRRTLADTVSGAAVVAGVAQALPVGTGLMDAVTVAQAFHWFANAVAVDELHRVIRPGGRLGLVWNHRDLTDPLQAAMDEILEPVRGETPSYVTGAWRRAFDAGDRFCPAGTTHVAWRQPVDVDGAVARVASVSFVAALPDDDRARLLDRVRGVALATAPPMALAYTTDVYCYARVG